MGNLSKKFTLSASKAQNLSRLSIEKRNELIDECLLRLTKLRNASRKGELSSEKKCVQLLHHILQPSFLIQGFEALVLEDQEFEHRFDLMAKHLDDPKQRIFFY